MFPKLTGLLICAWLAAPVVPAAVDVELPPAQAAKEDADGIAEDKDEGLPLEPRRNIRFETDEATWMSVDLSPDGRTIIFDLLWLMVYRVVFCNTDHILHNNVRSQERHELFQPLPSRRPVN